MKTFLTLFLLCACGFLSVNATEQRDRPERERPRRTEAIDRYFTRLSKQDPDEAKRLQELRQSNPRAFRMEMRERLKRKGGMHPKMQALTEDTSIQELVTSVKEAPSEEAYRSSKAKLREAVTQRYDQSLATREEALSQLRQKLVELEEKHAREKGKRDMIIDRQMYRLLNEQPRRPRPQE